MKFSPALNPTLVKKVETLVLSEMALFAENSVIGSQSDQSFCWKDTKLCRYCSRNELKRSVGPSVSGWKALDNRVLILNLEHRCFQKLDVNRVPRSEMIVFGRL